MKQINFDIDGVARLDFIFTQEKIERIDYYAFCKWAVYHNKSI